MTGVVKMKVMKEVKHFSHSDLDGIGCIVMAKHIFLHTAHTICEYNDVNEKVQDFLFQYINEKGEVKEVVPYELVLITDISVNEITALMLEHFSRVTNVPVKSGNEALYKKDSLSLETTMAAITPKMIQIL